MTHEPVLLNEVIEILKKYLNPEEKICVLDGTLGAGGYSLKILEEFPNSEVIGLDRDELAIKIASERLEKFDSRFKAVHGNFSNISEFFHENLFDALIFDLGVSNMQISIPERGFSFQNDGALDMRMDVNNNSLMTASEVLEKMTEQKLTEIFRVYGEERYARLIAHGIKNHNKKINTTFELVDLIRNILPQPVQRKMGTHPARRIFQALRIFVNDELKELENLLNTIPKLSASKDILIIIVSYHSLEDRLVKRTFRKWFSENNAVLITRHPITPSDEELEKNHKSRSGKLRAIFLRKN